MRVLWSTGQLNGTWERHMGEALPTHLECASFITFALRPTYYENGLCGACIVFTNCSKNLSKLFLTPVKSTDIEESFLWETFLKFQKKALKLI